MNSLICAEFGDPAEKKPCPAVFHATSEDEVMEELLRHLQKEHSAVVKAFLEKMTMDEFLAMMRTKIRKA